MRYLIIVSLLFATGCASHLKERVNSHEKSINSLFKEGAYCAWVELTRENMVEIGMPLSRRSDRAHVEKLWLYGCMEY